MARKGPSCQRSGNMALWAHKLGSLKGANNVFEAITIRHMATTMLLVSNLHLMMQTCQIVTVVAESCIATDSFA